MGAVHASIARFLGRQEAEDQIEEETQKPKAKAKPKAALKSVKGSPAKDPATAALLRQLEASNANVAALTRRLEAMEKGAGATEEPEFDFTDGASLERSVEKVLTKRLETFGKALMDEDFNRRLRNGRRKAKAADENYMETEIAFKKLADADPELFAAVRDADDPAAFVVEHMKSVGKREVTEEDLERLVEERLAAKSKGRKGASEDEDLSEDEGKLASTKRKVRAQEDDGDEEEETLEGSGDSDEEIEEERPTRPTSKTLAGHRTAPPKRKDDLVEDVGLKGHYTHTY